jgi:hypothetical protein
MLASHASLVRRRAGGATQLVGIVLSLVLGLGHAHAERRYALVIGANPGWGADRPLRYAETDAERIRDVLISLGGFTAERVTLLRDPDAAEVRAALRGLARTARDATGEDSLVFVYYSGHADDRYLHLRGEPSLSHAELQDTLRGLPATIRLAVIDACKSGAIVRKGGSPAGEFDVDLVAPQLSGMVLLTSSGADELSQETRALAGSVFTHHLVSGLRGAADADADQRVTVAEAYHYAYERTRADTATTGTPQRPAFRYDLIGQGELVLTELGSAKQAQLRIPRGPSQRYVVLDAHEWRLIAEARSDPGQDVVLAVAPGDYHVKRLLADQLELAVVVAAAGVVTDLSQIAYRDMPLSIGILKGEPSELSPAEHHEWARSHALGLLSDGQASAALHELDALVQQDPDDRLAQRGRGRALLQIADRYEQLGDKAAEQRALADAIRADPSLTHDPAIQRRYQADRQREAMETAARTAQRRYDAEVRDHPKRRKRLGVGLELASARGLFGLSGTFLVNETWLSSLVIDVAARGFDVNVVHAPISFRWSPYVAVGVHVALKRLGFDIPDPKLDDPTVLDMFGMAARIEAGVQYASVRGFTADLGFAVIGFLNPDDTLSETPWPVIHCGWLF